MSNYPKRVNCDVCSYYEKNNTPCSICFYKSDFLEPQDRKIMCKHCGGIARLRSDNKYQCFDCCWEMEK